MSQKQQNSQVSAHTAQLASLNENVQTPVSAANQIAKSRVDYVQVDALVLLKIIKHTQESGGGAELAQGILTGMVQVQDGNSKRIEITNCFGLPNANNLKAGTADYNEQCSIFITDNLKTFRHLNIDHLIIGWYQSSLFGNFVNKNFIEDHFMYQSEIEDSIVIIYDPFKTQHGSVYFKAFRLTPNMMEMQNRKDFSPDAIKDFKLNHENFMEELPVVVRNSHLVNSLLCELEDLNPGPKHQNFFDLATGSVLEKNLRSLMDNVDELTADTVKFLNYHKQLQKQNHLKQQHLQKREAENSARRARGDPPLPEEDINKIYKPLPPISRLETLLISNQIQNYCQQITDFTSQSLSNLFITEAVQNK